MGLMPAFNKLKCITKDSTEARGIVPHGRKAAAAFRPVEREGRDDRISSRLCGSLKPRHISSAITILSEEMECGSIMPDVVSLERLPERHIRDDPMNSRSRTSKARFGGAECGLGQVENGDVIKSAIE